MNKIFKVVWNRTIDSFVVTSELAKGRVKSSSEGAEGDVHASEEGRLKTLFVHQIVFVLDTDYFHG